jgi:hypothetical protein
MSLVLAETAVGGAAVLWLTPVWGKVRPAFYKLAGSVISTAGVLAWLAARAPLGGAGAPGARGFAFWLLAATALVLLAWQALLWSGLPTAGRALGFAAVPVGVAALAALAAIPGASHPVGLGVAQLVAGAFFLGAVTDGLLLGHWYLVDRTLSGDPLKRVGGFLLAGSVVAAGVTIAGGGGGGSANPSLSPLLGAGALAVAISVGLAALCTTIGFFVRALVREGSMQAATGFFYLAVIMALAAEFAAKIRFY